jgi:hypothetical protein
MAADTATASVDSMLADAISKMDALNKRMDALEVGPGSKNPIKGDDDDDKKDDAARSKSDDDDDDDDDKKRGDGTKADKKGDAITAPKTKILDDAKAASKTDGAKSSSKVDDGELEIKHGKEKDDAFPVKKAKDDAFPPPKKGAKDDDDDDKKDDDDDDKKDDATAKADDIGDLRKQIADQRATISRLESLVKPRSDDEHAAFADAQSRADAVFAGFGTRAPRPLEGEGLMDYRKRLANKLKTHSSKWKTAKLSRLDEDIFSPIEEQIYADAITAAANPVDLEAGELRAVTKTDPTTGVRTIVFYGKESFIKGMGRPGRRVAAFRTLQSV